MHWWLTGAKFTSMVPSGANEVARGLRPTPYAEIAIGSYADTCIQVAGPDADLNTVTAYTRQLFASVVTRCQLRIDSKVVTMKAAFNPGNVSQGGTYCLECASLESLDGSTGGDLRLPTT